MSAACPSQFARPAPNPQTTAWRILDGYDLEPGQEATRVDNFAGHWLVQTRDTGFPESLRGVTARCKAVKSLWWKRLDRDEQARSSQAPQRIEGEEVGERFLVEENGARFWIDFAAGYSQGIFLDQRGNRSWVREVSGDGDRVLNCFAYTGAFSVVAALEGAVTTTLDLSNPYLQWARENFAANDVDAGAHYFCRGDVIEWLQRFAKQGRRFKGVVLDPPSFSRTSKGKPFSVSRDYMELVRLAGEVLDDEAWLLACCNHQRMADWSFEEQVIRGLESAGRRVEQIELAKMPTEFAADDYLKSCQVIVG